MLSFFFFTDVALINEKKNKDPREVPWKLTGKSNTIFVTYSIVNKRFIFASRWTTSHNSLNMCFVYLSPLFTDTFFMVEKLPLELQCLILLAALHQKCCTAKRSSHITLSSTKKLHSNTLWDPGQGEDTIWDLSCLRNFNMFGYKLIHKSVW